MPFCPKCKYEYKQGILECSDCKIPLVDYLKEDEEEMPIELAQAIAYQNLAEELNLDDTEVPKGRIYAYQNKKEKAEEFKSSAYVLILVGALGLAALVLMQLQIIPVRLYAPGKYVTFGVMGALFVFFIIAGIRSFISSKKYASEAGDEDSNTKAILEYAENNLSKEKIIAMANINESLPDEMKYFKYSEIIKKIIISEFGQQDLSFLESICDEIYGKIFEE